jgi:hypothetical protein
MRVNRVLKRLLARSKKSAASPLLPPPAPRRRHRGASPQPSQRITTRTGPALGSGPSPQPTNAWRARRGALGKRSSRPGPDLPNL